MEEQLNNTGQEKQAKAYSRIRNKLILIDVVATAIILLLFLLSGASSVLSSFISSRIPSYLVKNAVYVVVAYLGYAIIYLPYSFYSGYILEHKFNLSNLTKRGWLWDYLKGLFLNVIIFVIIMEVIYVILRYLPNSWWLWSGIFWILFSIVLGKLTPVLILPLFYKIKKLENESLVNRLVVLAEKARVTILGVFEMNMSKKTKKANAMFAGLGSTKRIILGDTLLSQFSDDEIEVILAHELGHYTMKHIWQLLFFGSVTTLLGLYLTSYVIRFGVDIFHLQGVSDIAGFPLFALSMATFFMILTPLMNAFSRKLERDADLFALENTGNSDAFISSMNKLAEQNLSDRSPSAVIEFLLYSHPSIAKRVKMAQQFAKRHKNPKSA